MGERVANAAEDLVRAGGGSSITWEGVRLTTHFQPIYCARRGTCTGFEALARSVDDPLRPLVVEEFFAAADDAGRTLLDWACRALHLRNFATVDPSDRMLFINVHPEAAVKDARRGTELGQLIGYYGLVPQRVCIEILEASCSDESMLRNAVDAYHDLGVSVAVDDFGTGSSDFDRVARLRPDIVKIDLAGQAKEGGMDQALRRLPGTIELLHDVRAKVVVEGIESRTQAVLAVGARADFLQGFFFAHPQPRLAPEAEGANVLGGVLNPGSRSLHAVL